MILGQATPSANTDTLLYTVPSGKKALFFVNFYNGNSTKKSCMIYLLKSSESTPVPTESIIDIKHIDGYDTYASDSYVLSAGQKVYVKCDAANFSVNVNGFEEDV